VKQPSQLAESTLLNSAIAPAGSHDVSCLPGLDLDGFTSRNPIVLYSDSKTAPMIFLQKPHAKDDDVLSTKHWHKRDGNGSADSKARLSGL